MRYPKDLTGLKFGRLTVIKKSDLPREAGKTFQWDCVCKCENKITVPRDYLVQGSTKSCGCLKSELSAKRLLTHGNRHTPEYASWAHMKQRCTNPSCKDYRNYGGRGISICQKWLDSFESFYKDMGKRPTPSHSLERIDVNGNYEPSNCTWATKRQQSLNTRRNTFYTFNHQTLTLSDWAKDTGINRLTLLGRIQRGWPIEKALTTPVRTK